jgi:poly(beta-D-mannuronate) lyase
LVMGLTLSSPCAAMNVPFSVPARQMAKEAIPCPDAPQAVTSLTTEQPYKTGDGTFSQLDLQKNAVREAKLAPIRAYNYQVTKWANTYAFSGGRDLMAGVCALRWLDSWAQQGAMLQLEGHDPYWLNILHITTWSAAYSQVGGLDLGKDDPRPRIKKWLSAMAYNMSGHFDSLSATNTVRHNNHRYWAGFAALSVAANTNDATLFNWGIASAREGLRQITPQGTLPLEIKRANKARHYSIYAAGALVMSAEYAMANGVDLYNENDGALHQLVKVSLQSVFRPDAMASLTGAGQDPYTDKFGGLYLQGLAWVEFYDRRFPGRLFEIRQIMTHRPLINSEIGGNITRLLMK